MPLRDYQRECLESILQYFQVKSGNPLCCLPTGSGKSHIISGFIDKINEYPDQRIIVLAHRKELIEQNAAKCNCEHGIYSAGLNRKQHKKNVVFAGIQSVYKHPQKFGKRDIMIIDECHLVPHKSEGQYRAFIDGLLETNEHMKIVGFTATPYRMSGS